jgi:hypothetical protein
MADVKFSALPAVAAAGTTDVLIGLDGGATASKFAAVDENFLALTDVTVNNSATTKHGFLKKLSNVATEYMDGSGNWSIPVGSTSIAGFTAGSVPFVATGPVLAQDNANFFYDDTNDVLRLGGVTSTLSNTSNGARPFFQQGGTSTNGSATMFVHYNTSAAVSSRMYICRSKGSSFGSMTAVTTGDAIGRTNYEGSDGSNFRESTRIVAEVDGAVSSSVVPGRYVVNTANSSGTITQATVTDSQQRFTTKGRILAVRVVTAAGAVTVATSDDIVIVNKGTGAATAANLPATPATGTRFIIKDGKGDAATNNITITPAAGTIDGAGTIVMNANYQSKTVVYNGTEWNVI